MGGTLRERSYSRAALREALRIAAEQGAHTEILDLRALNLPMFVPGYGIEDYPAAHRAAIARLVESCRRATAMIWASPTYHGTVSGAFKNAIDYLELLSDDRPAYLSGKAVGLIAINDSKTFSAMSNAVHELRAWLAPTHVQLSKSDFDDNMRLSSERAVRLVGQLVNELLGFCQR
ncbi:MAG: NAD(P)H-dependent oxidoreductase [Thermoflexales bacterium]|nr:NAD(P)H-dependent oxidoreductase [Thermoflexales bacterium]